MNISSPGPIAIGIAVGPSPSGGRTPDPASSSTTERPADRIAIADEPGYTAAAPAQESSETGIGLYRRLRDLSDDEFETTAAGIENSARYRYLRHDLARDDQARSPAYKAFATVTAGGQVVATVDNGGYVMASGEGKAKDWSDDSQADLRGPALARARADRVARLEGGRVNIQPTAQTQAQFDATPPLVLKFDEAALVQDPQIKVVDAVRKARAAAAAQASGEAVGHRPPVAVNIVV